MTIDNHDKGSKKIHNKMEDNAKVNGIKRMSDEEFDRELIEIKLQLNVIM
jgi:hypothetical protein